MNLSPSQVSHLRRIHSTKSLLKSSTESQDSAIESEKSHLNLRNSLPTTTVNHLNVQNQKQNNSLYQRIFVVQAAGHRNSIQLSNEDKNLILKIYDKNEHQILKLLNEDLFFRQHVPKLQGTSFINGPNNESESEPEKYLTMENLTSNFQNFTVLDVKMGFQTFDDEDVGVKTKPRSDLYQKFITNLENSKKISNDNNSNSTFNMDLLTETEKLNKTLTKARYLSIRDAESTTFLYGYRFEGISNNVDEERITTTGKCSNEKQAIDLLYLFLQFGNQQIVKKFILNLKKILLDIQKSPLFLNLKFIGNSLLFIYENDYSPEVSGMSREGVNCDDCRLGIIDFAKVKYDRENSGKYNEHQRKWLKGLENLIEVFEAFYKENY